MTKIKNSSAITTMNINSRWAMPMIIPAVAMPMPCSPDSLICLRAMKPVMTAIRAIVNPPIPGMI